MSAVDKTGGLKEAAQLAWALEKIARDKVEEVVDEVRAEAKHLATEVKSKVKRTK